MLQAVRESRMAAAHSAQRQSLRAPAARRERAGGRSSSDERSSGGLGNGDGSKKSGSGGAAATTLVIGYTLPELQAAIDTRFKPWKGVGSVSDCTAALRDKASLVTTVVIVDSIRDEALTSARLHDDVWNARGNITLYTLESGLSEPTYEALYTKQPSVPIGKYHLYEHRPIATQATSGVVLLTTDVSHAPQLLIKNAPIIRGLTHATGWFDIHPRTPAYGHTSIANELARSPVLVVDNDAFADKTALSGLYAVLGTLFQLQPMKYSLFFSGAGAVNSGLVQLVGLHTPTTDATNTLLEMDHGANVPPPSKPLPLAPSSGGAPLQSNATASFQTNPGAQPPHPPQQASSPNNSGTFGGIAGTVKSGISSLIGHVQGHAAAAPTGPTLPHHARVLVISTSQNHTRSDFDAVKTLTAVDGETLAWATRGDAESQKQKVAYIQHATKVYNPYTLIAVNIGSMHERGISAVLHAADACNAKVLFLASNGSTMKGITINTIQDAKAAIDHLQEAKTLVVHAQNVAPVVSTELADTVSLADISVASHRYMAGKYDHVLLTCETKATDAQKESITKLLRNLELHVAGTPTLRLVMPTAPDPDITDFVASVVPVCMYRIGTGVQTGPNTATPLTLLGDRIAGVVVLAILQHALTSTSTIKAENAAVNIARNQGVEGRLAVTHALIEEGGLIRTTMQAAADATQSALVMVGYNDLYAYDNDRGYGTFVTSIGNLPGTRLIVTYASDGDIHLDYMPSRDQGRWGEKPTLNTLLTLQSQAAPAPVPAQVVHTAHVVQTAAAPAPVPVTAYRITDGSPVEKADPWYYKSLCGSDGEYKIVDVATLDEIPVQTDLRLKSALVVARNHELLYDVPLPLFYKIVVVRTGQNAAFHAAAQQAYACSTTHSPSVGGLSGLFSNVPIVDVYTIKHIRVHYASNIDPGPAGLYAQIASKHVHAGVNATLGAYDDSNKAHFIIVDWSTLSDDDTSKRCLNADRTGHNGRVILLGKDRNHAMDRHAWMRDAYKCYNTSSLITGADGTFYAISMRKVIGTCPVHKFGASRAMGSFV